MAHQRIDVHQHVAPRAYAAWLQAQGIQDAGGRELPPWSVQAALAPGKVKFNAELIDLEQDAAGVTATVRDRTVASDFVVRVRYRLACDGGRTIGRRLGVELQGTRNVMRIVSVYMSADLSHWARDPDVLIRWLWLPHRGTFGTLVPMGPDHWGPQSEEWVYHQNYENEDTSALDDSRVLADMKESLGLPYLDATIHVISRLVARGHPGGPLPGRPRVLRRRRTGVCPRCQRGGEPGRPPQSARRHPGGCGPSSPCAGRNRDPIHGVP